MRLRSVLALSLVLGSLVVVTVGSAGHPDLGSVGTTTGTGASPTTDGSTDASANIPPIEGNETACPPGVDRGDRTAVDEPTIVALYPNPTTEENVGEYVLLETPNETDVAGWTLTDGHTTATLPNETIDGRVALTIDAEATAGLTDETPLELEGHVRLATDGDSLELRDGERLLDRVAYDRAPLAERWYRTDERTGNESGTHDGAARGTWWPTGASCVPPAAGGPTDAKTFVLPDSPDVALETIRDADERILLAGYTFTSEPVTNELLEAADRGVTVRVLIESGPVGGVPADTAAVLDQLESSDVDVRTIGGRGGRYAYHHPKYAVVDETVLVTTENWKPSGIGGHGSRGWGTVLTDSDIAATLADVFQSDFEGRDTESGERLLERERFAEADEGRTQSYPVEHDPETVDVERTELLVAPDNAEGRLLELLDAAREEILITQASLGGTDVSLVEATVAAARRGVDVRILLDDTWYVEDENRAVAAELEEAAAEEELPIDVKLVDSDGRFEKIHAKGVVIDGETAIVGSLNWNENALEENREVLVALHGEEAAAYYTTVFDADWQGGSWPVPIEFSLAVVAALLAAAVVGHRYVRFGDERSPGDSYSLGGGEYDPSLGTTVEFDPRAGEADGELTGLETRHPPSSGVPPPSPRRPPHAPHDRLSGDCPPHNVPTSNSNGTDTDAESDEGGTDTDAESDDRR